jgi:fibronectin-binding autotransporter adhesin
VALDGTLRISLINGFTPDAGNTFDILTSSDSGSALSGDFSNVTDGQIWALDGYSRFDISIDTVNKRVRLSNYALNEWDSTNGGSWSDANTWSITEPNSSIYGAYFGANLTAAGTVTLNTPRTVRGVAFNNAAAYTLAGSSALTLAGDAAATSLITVIQGSHSIATALTLTDALSIDVVQETDTLTISGAMTGDQELTKIGLGTLALSGNNALGAVTVSDGTLRMADGSSTYTALDIEANATYALHTGTLTLEEGLTVSGNFNFETYGCGTLVLTRGIDGGAIDTVDEVYTAINAGLITAKGNTADASLFAISESEINSEWSVIVRLKTDGTIIIIQ